MVTAQTPIYAKRLQDKVCVVTGAGQGIGRAAARRLGLEGCKVVIADRVEASASDTTDELRSLGVEALKVIVDLSNHSGACELVAKTKQAFGRLDVLVNNVGGTIWIKPYDQYREEEVRLEIERSLFPTLWCCLAALPVMMEQKSGSIVNLGSQAVRGIYRVPYAAAKGGIHAMSKVLAMEYGKFGIRVNTVSPGGTDITDRVTPRNMIRPGLLMDEGPAQQMDSFRREMLEDGLSQQALKRRGSVDEQAAAIAFLASDDAAFITGEVINTSGGA